MNTCNHISYTAAAISGEFDGCISVTLRLATGFLHQGLSMPHYVEEQKEAYGLDADLKAKMDAKYDTELDSGHRTICLDFKAICMRLRTLYFNILCELCKLQENEVAAWIEAIINEPVKGNFAQAR
eukprot:6456673-Amphidinium_carterae.1